MTAINDESLECDWGMMMMCWIVDEKMMNLCCIDEHAPSAELYTAPARQEPVCVRNKKWSLMIV